MFEVVCVFECNIHLSSAFPKNEVILKWDSFQWLETGRFCYLPFWRVTFNFYLPIQFFTRIWQVKWPYGTPWSCCGIKYWFTVICENSSYEQTHAHTYTHNHSHTHTYVLFHMFLVDLDYTLVKCWYEISVFLKYENFNILITTSIQIQHFPIPKTTASEYHNIG